MIAQSSQLEAWRAVLYLAPTVQLVNQTIEKAQALGISAVPYVKGQDLDEDFVNGKAVMVATYKALFNGQSKFRLRGHGHPQPLGTVLLDDAHAAFSEVRETFTLQVSSKDDLTRFKELAGLFRRAFNEIGKLERSMIF